MVGNIFNDPIALKAFKSFLSVEYSEMLQTVERLKIHDKEILSQLKDFQINNKPGQVMPREFAEKLIKTL